MQLPQKLLQSLQGTKGFDKEAFEQVHQSGEQVTSVRINPEKFSNLHSPFSNFTNVPWTELGYYLDKRPSFTFDPLFHAGCYYVQEASSMFLEHAIKQTVDVAQPLRVLDLSAAPGGKSTHLQSLLSKESLLVSNEVIKARAAILKQNIIKWGSVNVFVTNNDPQHFQRLKGFFDVIVVDAPCSGSGLFRRDEEAIKEWSPEAVQLCSGRQQRILANVLPALKESGILIYSTCSYSPEEDEQIADWLVADFEMKSLPLQYPPEWNIIETQSEKHKAYGYRFYPDKVKGEGFFIACFQKTGTTSNLKYKQAKPEKASAKEKAILAPWLKENTFEVIKHHNTAIAIPSSSMEDFSILQANLYIQYAGIGVGEWMRDKLIPDHALAMSPYLSDNISKEELGYEDAIRFLQRQEITIETEKGWKVVTYKNAPLGWINALGNRINNYYPKELRILKQNNTSGFEK